MDRTIRNIKLVIWVLVIATAAVGMAKIHHHMRSVTRFGKFIAHFCYSLFAVIWAIVATA